MKLLDKYISRKANRKRLDNYYRSMSIKSLTDLDRYAEYIRQGDRDDRFKAILLIAVIVGVIVLLVLVS